MVVADLHLHTDLSKDGSLSPQRLIEVAQMRGLDCLAVTDHNAVAAALEMQRNSPVRIIVGEEVLSSEGEIIGYFLRERIPRDLPPREVVSRIKAQGGLVCVPHPFDRLRRGVLSNSALLSILPQVDIIEGYNSRCLLTSDNRRAQDFARAHGLPTSAGSDGHTAGEIGRSRVQMPDFDGPASFLESLRQGMIEGKPSGLFIHFLSTANKWRRRLRPRLA